MKQPEASELIEAWLDGRVEGREAVAFQSRLERDPDFAAELELAERIRASLRRSFTPPAWSSAPVPAVRRVAGAAAPWRRVTTVLAAAAAVFLILRITTHREPATEELLHRIAPVGPLAQLGDEVAVSAPNLELLYQETLAESDGLSMTCGPDDDLGATLAAAYGESVTLRPEANEMLSGPYASTRWPTGTILRGAGSNPAVLIAERDTTHRCCVLFELSAESELNLFTWQLGDLVLTEITPLAEPRLLGYFE
jgi:hypothetical protein